MIAFAPDDDQALLIDGVRRFAAGTVRPAMRAWERAGEVEAAARRAFDRLALGLLDVPEALGGGGQGLLTAALLHEELAFGDAAAAVTLWAPHLAAAAVSELGDDQQGARLLVPFAGPAADAALGAVAWSEPLASTSAIAGDDADSGGTGPGALAGFATRAVPVEGGYRLHGRKAQVVHGGRAALTVVFAQVEAVRGWDGVGAFALAGQPAGLQAGPRATLLGLGAVPIVPLSLDGVLVPERDRLRGRGAFAARLERLMLRAMIVGAARQVGLARAAYEQALAYTQERHAFGKPVAHFQSISFALADMHTEVEAARWLTWQAAHAFDRLPPPASDEAASADPLRCEVVRRCAQATVGASRCGFQVADQAVQLFGGAGYMRDLPVEKWLRDTRCLALLGPTEEQAELAAGDALLGAPPLWALWPHPSLQPSLL